MTTPQEVLAYWLDELGPKSWYEGGEKLDAEIREKFLDVWTKAVEGHLGFWLTCPTETLAYIIDRDWDLQIDEPARHFFYMPLLHSENLIDQDRGVRLMHLRLKEDAENTINHAKAHREVIRRYGRFPFRNKALGRSSSDQEKAFMAAGGYGDILREVQASETA